MTCCTGCQRQRPWELGPLYESWEMMSINELFYGQIERSCAIRVWPVYAPPGPKRDPKSEEKMTTLPSLPKEPLSVVVLDVPMCCGQCEDRIKVRVREMDGVKDVACNWYKREVAVSGKNLDRSAILLMCKSVFGKAAIDRERS